MKCFVIVMVSLVLFVCVSMFFVILMFILGFMVECRVNDFGLMLSYLSFVVL